MRAQRTAPPSTLSLADQFQNWYAANDPGTVAQWSDPAQDAASWKTMTLPMQWENAGDSDLANFDGIVWFRKEVTLPAGAEASDLKLYLGQIDDIDTSWVNGVQVGADLGTERIYTVPKSILKPDKNIITIRVLDTGGAGGLYTGAQSTALRNSRSESYCLDWSLAIQNRRIARADEARAAKPR